MNLTKLPRSFYLRPTLRVAKDLLGKHFIRRIGQTLLVGKIVEVEAYLGASDPASHAYRGLTKRNEVMFREGGHLYVYFTYGMHYCCNVVTETEGRGHAVLLRAVEPVLGIETMQKYREKGHPHRKMKLTPSALTDGPAKLCQAFGIGRAENGADLLGDEMYIAEGESIPRSTISSSPRIGITAGTEKEWRYFVKGNRFISR